MERQLLNSDALAMIEVSSRETSRHLLFDSRKHLCGRDNQTLNQTTLLPEREAAYSYAFGGVHILRPQIFDYFTHRGTFSIIDEYLSLAKDHHIDPIMHNAQTWFDVGKIEQLSAIEEAIKPGISTYDLDIIAEKTMETYGAKSAAKGYPSGVKGVPDYPANTCI